MFVAGAEPAGLALAVVAVVMPAVDIDPRMVSAAAHDELGIVQFIEQKRELVAVAKVDVLFFDLEELAEPIDQLLADVLVLSL
jgi:hypothetical protein